MRDPEPTARMEKMLLFLRSGAFDRRLVNLDHEILLFGCS